MGVCVLCRVLLWSYLLYCHVLFVCVVSAVFYCVWLSVCVCMCVVGGVVMYGFVFVMCLCDVCLCGCCDECLCLCVAYVYDVMCCDCLFVMLRELCLAFGC